MSGMRFGARTIAVHSVLPFSFSLRLHTPHCSTPAPAHLSRSWFGMSTHRGASDVIDEMLSAKVGRKRKALTAGDVRMSKKRAHLLSTDEELRTIRGVWCLSFCSLAELQILK